MRESKNMPRAIPLPIRQSLWESSQAGVSTAELARRFHLPQRTVRHLVKTTRDNNGQVACPAYSKGRVRDFPRDLLERARALKEQHPCWGAGFILEIMALDNPEKRLPCVRTLQDWFKDLNLPAAPAGRKGGRYSRAGKVHQRWQTDAAEQMKLPDGGWASWLRVTDECSGAVLATELFPPQPLLQRAAFAGARPVAAVV
jgi:hypothetical protein